MRPDQNIVGSTAVVDDFVQKAAQTLESQAEEIAEELVAAYKERIPSYANASEESMQHAREWAVGSVLVSTGIVAGKQQPSEFYEALRDVGRRRAEEGFPLHDVLLANLI